VYFAITRPDRRFTMAAASDMANASLAVAPEGATGATVPAAAAPAKTLAD
jgi:hypothetical protein